MGCFGNYQKRMGILISAISEEEKLLDHKELPCSAEISYTIIYIKHIVFMIFIYFILGKFTYANGDVFTVS